MTALALDHTPAATATRLRELAPSLALVLGSPEGLARAATWPRPVQRLALAACGARGYTLEGAVYYASVPAAHTSRPMTEAEIAREYATCAR